MMSHKTGISMLTFRLWLTSKYSLAELDDMLPKLNTWLERGDGVAVYENEELGHPQAGHVQICSFGSADAQIESELPPQRMPDIGPHINWRYSLLMAYKGEPVTLSSDIRAYLTHDRKYIPPAVQHEVLTWEVAGPIVGRRGWHLVRALDEQGRPVADRKPIEVYGLNQAEIIASRLRDAWTTGLATGVFVGYNQALREASHEAAAERGSRELLGAEEEL